MRKKEMIVPVGFSSYKVHLTKKCLEVYGKIKRLTPQTDAYHKLRKYYMKHDSGKYMYVSELRLAYAVKKGVDYTKLSNSLRLYGTVDNILI